MKLLKRILDRLRAKKRVTPHEPEFAKQMEVAEEVMHEWRGVLRKLGK